MRIGVFTASVIIDGKALEEYDVVMENPTKATCWISSQEGKNFAVQWKCHSKTRQTCSVGRVNVDGVRCRGRIIEPGPLGRGDTQSRSYVSTNTKTRDFVFSRLQLSDDDTLLDKSVPKDLGEISLTIQHGKLLRVRVEDHHVDKGLDVPGLDDKFHEKAKKATVHRVNFGPEKTRRPRKGYGLQLIRDGGGKLEFVFKYRPLDVLQANGIAPSTVGTSSHLSRSRVEPRDSDIEVTDGADIKPAELDEKIRSLENELKRLRSQRGSTSEDRKPKRVKKEDSRTETRPTFSPGEVIDLT
ncbi:hypothetical protein F5I97DRAFT_1434817 [Phlebopus sp. FC_14]|nr:hypothetical protein F5I97DRAFT_1434817 [Phlebopus sp. FC_14]